MDSQTNVPTEIKLGVFGDAEIDVVFTAPDGSERRVPAFLAGDGSFRVRFAALTPGKYTYRAICAYITGEIEIAPYEGDNPLYQHGRLRMAQNNRTLEHSDGAPFFWMGDTWWMGLTTRLDWPDGFFSLATDRITKGFNLVQIVAGPLPNFDAVTESWHPMQANEAGLPWEENWMRINPAYYDMADRRIAYLVEHGLMPCIVGMWGYYISFMGVENAKKHWRNLIARYGAYPVVWCIAGEVTLPTYSRHSDPKALAADQVSQAREWTEVARYARELDPYHNLITAHPWITTGGRTAVTDETVLDIDMLQTDHGGHSILKQTVDWINIANTRKPRMPVINGEPCYEGVKGTGWKEMQRFVFWTSITSGSAGHTYGAQGIWQMSTREEPYSQEWGEGFWREAMHYPGSAQVAMGRRFFERYPWWRFETRHLPEVEKLGRISSFATGIPGAVWVFYLSGIWMDPIFAGVQGIRIPIEPGASYRAYFFDPRSGAETDIGLVQPDSDGLWLHPAKPTMEDLILVLEES